MDISDINNIGRAWASWERDEANKGKGVRSKGWVTKEQMRKNAAQKTLGIMIAVAVLTGSSRCGFANLLYHQRSLRI